MARVILETAGEDITVGGSDVVVVGTIAADEVITVTGGNVALDASFNQGGDTIVLPGAATSYTAAIVSGRLVLSNGTTTLNMPVSTAATTLVFEGGEERDVVIVDGELLIGEQVIEGETVLEGETGNTAALGEALADLQAEQEDLAEFLADVPDVNGDGASTEDDVEFAVNAAEDALAADIQEDGSDATLQDNLEDAQEEIAEIPGLAAAINAVAAEEVQFEAVLEQQAVTSVELFTEAQVFDIRSSFSSVTVTGTELTALAAGDAVVTANVDADAEPEDLIIVGEDGQLVAADASYTTQPGFDALLADAQRAYDAAQDAVAAEAEFEAALTQLLDLEGVVDTEAETYIAEDYYTVSADGNVEYGSEVNTPRLAALEQAQAELAEREVLYENLAIAQDRAEELEEFQDDVDDAQDAITALGFAQPELIDGAEAATVSSDIFLTTGENGTIANFGEEGDDLIFIGEGFTAVRAPDGTDLNAEGAAGAAGDPTELEVFIVQTAGGDTQLWIENTPFAGSDTTGAFDGQVITLTETDADLVNLNTFGFVAETIA